LKQVVRGRLALPRYRPIVQVEEQTVSSEWGQVRKLMTLLMVKHQSQVTAVVVAKQHQVPVKMAEAHWSVLPLRLRLHRLVTLRRDFIGQA